MNLFFCIILICCVVVCYGTNGGWFYEMRRGRCAGEKLAAEDIVKPGSPHTIKTTTFTWRGENSYKITCVNVLNHMDTRDAATFRVKQGGIDYSEVIIEMTTQLGKGMNFHLEVYGEPIRSGYYQNRL